MGKNYLDIVDKVIVNAFEEGFATPPNSLWDNYAIKARLELYGYKEEQRYYLNELGIRYVMDGCSKGLKDKVQRQEEIERLDIDNKSFTKSKQSMIYWMSVVSFFISILAFFGGYEVLQGLLLWLSNLVELLCSS